MRRRPRRVVAVLALAATLASVGDAAAQVYHWTDDERVDHYSSDRHRVPDRYRARMRVIEAPTPGVETGAGGDPGAMLFTSGSPILADAHVNGVPLALLVDTGAERTVISAAALERAGFAVAAGRAVRIVGVTGAADAREVVVLRLDVAGAQIGPMAVFAHDVPGLRADGLLGRDVLDHFVLTIDATRGRAVLSR
jgi:hypothetical protein